MGRLGYAGDPERTLRFGKVAACVRREIRGIPFWWLTWVAGLTTGSVGDRLNVDYESHGPLILLCFVAGAIMYHIGRKREGSR